MGNITKTIELVIEYEQIHHDGASPTFVPIKVRKKDGVWLRLDELTLKDLVEFG